MVRTKDEDGWKFGTEKTHNEREGTTINKSEHFSFRVTPRARFATEFCARAAGLSASSFIERAILKAARSTKVDGRTFDKYWDSSPGVSFCNTFLITDEDFDFSIDEERTKAFVLAHKQFFYERRDDGSLRANRAFVETLWPTIRLQAEHWYRHKETDAYATAEKMAEALKKAGHKPPAWGPKASGEWND